jgi:DNA-binding IclR family transcriptional regulator
MDSLTPTDLACLDVIRAHSGTVSTIALRAKLTMKEAAASLARLSAAGLVQQAERHRWEANARNVGRYTHHVLASAAFHLVQRRSECSKSWNAQRPALSWHELWA